MKNSILTALLLLAFGCVAQTRKPLYGKIVISGEGIAGIFIINKNTGTETKSSTDGLFTIEAKPGDNLAVFHQNIVSRDFVISNASFETNPYVLETELKGEELKEVVINAVTSESLGLVPRGQKRVTEPQRRLMKYSSGSGLTYLINALTGKLKPLKRARETVKKYELKDQVWNLITDADIKQCGVSAEMAKGFIFYAIEDKRVKAAIDSGSAEIKLLLIEIAEEYLKLQKESCKDC